jgi:hypothetical protein
MCRIGVLALCSVWAGGGGQDSGGMAIANVLNLYISGRN